MAETLSEGVVIPNANGGETISATGVAEMRALGSTVNTAITNARYTKGRLQTGGDVFTLAPGVYTVGSLLDASQIANLPEEWPGTLIVEGNHGQAVKAVRFIPYQKDYSWETANKDLSNGFMPWRKSGATLSPYAQHAVRQSKMMYDVGPVDTGGLGAVAWRIDHGLTNFRDQLLPIFRAAGIVPMITLNSRDWGRAENAGVTQSEVNQWVADGWVEISNHGATHSNATGQTDIYDFVANGLAELEAQLPAAKGKVYGFCIPGVGVTDAFDGFAGGNSPEQWDTYAGRLILQHHAVGYGHMAGTNPRILDGVPRDGMLHMATDTRAVSEMTAAIDDAIAQRKGLQIMSHPSNLDTAGYHSTADIQAIVDHIVAKRDTGELAVLSSYQMMVADATILPAPDLSSIEAQLAALTYRSGRRNITALLDPAPVSGNLYIERRGDVVWLHMDGLVLTSTEFASRLYSNVIADGFKTIAPIELPSAPRVIPTDPPGTSDDADTSIRTYNHVLGFYRIRAGMAIRGLVSWPTNQAIPTTLPGVPA